MPYSALAGIRFNDCVFTEPVPTGGWTAPRWAGLYVILVRDANWAPKPYQPLCFGEFGNNTPGAAMCPEQAHHSTAGQALYVAVLPLPFSTTAQRWALLQELVSAYNPAWQPAGIRPTELVEKLDELERRHHEQGAQLGRLRARAEGWLEPHPAPRRRIGFMPHVEPAG
jgi:hypothetical protein